MQRTSIKRYGRLGKTPIYAEYNEAKKHYEQLMDKKQLKNVARITRFHIIPLINNEICYFAVCLADRTDYEVFRVPSIWIILEQNKLDGARDMLWNKKNMDELLFRSARRYRDDQEPDIFLPMEPFEKVKIPHNLGIGGDLKKFERLVPYLENMKLDAAPKRDWEYFFLSRGTYPIGEYNGVIYFLLKIKNKKWEECPVFDIDGALEMEGCMPLAENLSAFIKLGIMAHSFMELSFIARRPEKEYRIDGQQYRDWDVSEEIAVLEENFHLPEIDNVITYIDTLKRKKSYARKGKAVLHKMFKKRGMKEEYYDTYGGWRWF